MSVRARKLIAKNKKTHDPFLDLGNCYLSKIPEEIGQMTWLRSLNLGSEWWEFEESGWRHKESQNRGRPNKRLTDLSPLSGLTSLQSLNVWGTQVTDLSPLSGLTVLQSLFASNTLTADLSPLSDLTNLKTLHISGTQVADLHPLSGLTALQSLYAWETQIVDLSPLSGLTALKSLDASRTHVTDLSPLSGLTALKSLDASRTHVTDLSSLSGLTSLQSLYVYGTQVADLSPLSELTTLQTLNISGTQVADLSPLSGLTSLQSLHVWGTQVADFGPLSNLTSLQSLDMSGTQIADLTPLSSLIALQSLYAMDTQVVDLSPLSCITTLQKLLISGTQVADLYPLSVLTLLQTINVSNTQITNLTPLRSRISEGLPVHWSSKSWERPGIYVEGCPLTTPPPEIVQQGNEAILNYFRERDAGEVDHLYEAKMLILGEGGAGKTSLLRRLYQPEQPLPGEKETTKGIAIHRQEFDLSNGRRFRLNVWDFGGQEIYHATHQFFLTHRSLYLLLDDSRKDHKSVTDEGFKYWLDLIDTFGGHSPVLVFQNQKGGRSKTVDQAGIKGRFDNVKDFYAGNLEQCDAAATLREAIEFHASQLSHIGEELPARWIQVREEIEQEAEWRPHMPVQDYYDLYARHLPANREKALFLSRYLHDLGVFLHFQDDALLRRTVILHNEWATEAVYRVLDDEAVKARRGRFNGADCVRLWRDSAYAEMHPELLALMQRFELCYALPDARSWLSPQLLPPSRPAALDGWGRSGDLVRQYRYDFLPKGLISRLIVRMHRYLLDPELAWLSGALFQRDGSSVLVELLPSGREIALRARGSEAKALLSVIAADLDALNEGFQGLRDKVDTWIPCNCPSCRKIANPEFFAQKELLRRKEHGRLQVECRSSYKEVDVLELLDGARLADKPAWAEKPVRTLQLFLASSSELRDDRDAFELYVRQQNDRLLKQGMNLEVVRWEHFLDALSETRLQDKYNKAVRKSDLFVSLFFTKAGKFTQEEFDHAYGQFKVSGQPRIYTYFKTAEVSMGKLGEEVISLLEFKKRLNALGHYPSDYENMEALKNKFREQLDLLLDEGM